MRATKHFPDELLAQLKKSKVIRVRAGSGTHRFIGIWFVLVNDRVFARSWSVKPRGWYRRFLLKPYGAVQVGKAEIPARGVPIRSRRLRDEVDRAYMEKYGAGWELKYARDLIGEKSRTTTIEFVALRPSKAAG